MGGKFNAIRFLAESLKLKASKKKMDEAEK
jgi:hypothetical protein